MRESYAEAGETVPAQFEFLLEGHDVSETDLAIRCGESSYVVTLINLRDGPRDLRLRVRLKGKEMGRYEVSRVDERSPIAVERSAGNLYCNIHLPPLASAVVRLDERRKN